jgi:hypothetical protein
MIIALTTSDENYAEMRGDSVCAKATLDGYYLLHGAVSFLRGDSECAKATLDGYYLLTPWSSILLEKLTGLQLVKKFPTFYGTERFITTFTSACHPSLT